MRPIGGLKIRPANLGAMARLARKVALVTGAASGIGRATAIVLAREGANVAVTDIDICGAASTVEAIITEGGSAIPLALDVTSEPAWQSAIDTAIAVWGQLDILVNNAGISHERSITETTLDQWRRVLAVNLDGVFLGTAAAIRAMSRGRGGSIINVSSLSGAKAAPGAAAYCASKAGVIMLTKTAALECAGANPPISVNCILPGGVKTPMWESTTLWPAIAETDEWQATVGLPPSKRFAQPEEIAQAILFLASNESSYITAAALPIDAGASA
jgi:NAD(P)-dependent dehydrogenase (short-subunit alcohol dehydrogenase family)